MQCAYEILWFSYSQLGLDYAQIAKWSDVSTRTVRLWLSRELDPSNSRAFSAFYWRVRQAHSRALSHAVSTDDHSRYIWSSPGQARYSPEWMITAYIAEDGSRWLLAYERRGQLERVDTGPLQFREDIDELLQELAEHAVQTVGSLSSAYAS